MSHLDKLYPYAQIEEIHGGFILWDEVTECCVCQQPTMWIHEQLHEFLCSFECLADIANRFVSEPLDLCRRSRYLKIKHVCNQSCS
jgi:hypothetical protein